jgi:hypothetical protein
MNPVLAAALVGVSGTVIVGVAGFGASIWSTTKTLAHARESRVWDRRADVYIQALAAVNYRQISRQYDTLSPHPANTKVRERVQEYLATHEQPDWPELEARLQAFASEPVFTAVQASSTAHREAMIRFNFWRVLARPDTGDEAHKAEVATYLATGRAKAEKIWKAAEAADDAVVEQIRTELQGRGRPLGDWQAFPEQGPPPPDLLDEEPHAEDAE